VPRVLAIVVGIALLGAAGQLSRLHTHAYSGHDHPEHQHGLASHEHDQASHAADNDGLPHVESCDAERHAVSFIVGCTPALTTVAFHANVLDAPSIAPTLTVQGTATVTDVRVHGPPAAGMRPSRAPPEQFPA
jgi:hypothetical protein